MAERIPTMCLNCSTVCGMIAKVENGRILKLEGNPHDPNSRGKLCAKGQAAINMVEDPDRLLYPLRRVGQRGSGQWERISWDAAIAEISARLRRLRAEGRQTELMLQYGRDRTNGFLDRFADAFGTPNKLGHRGLCSLNKRMAIRASIGDTDWDTADFAESRYILNFGSNFYEAHQGHVGMLQRFAEAKRHGARMVTFDVRLSNTAAQSDEWIPIFPGTDGLVALAIGHVILRDDLQNTAFIHDWTNAPLEEWRAHYLRYTPEWAERESGVPANTIERIAHEFAAAAPCAATVSNRGTHAHRNGFYNEWAVVCLNALVGSIGERGGWGYIPGDVNKSAPQPSPLPPKPKSKTELSHPSEFPLVNELYPRAVSSTIYPYLAFGRANIDTMISYYVNAPMSWPEGPTFVRDVLLDEEIVPFHVAIDAFPSETVEVADIVLPDATFLEKWDLDARNSYDFRPYVGLRQPVVNPPGECKDIRDILIAIGKAVDEEMARFFPYENAEEFIREWAKAVPGGLDELKKTGVWVDENQPRHFRPYLQETGHRIGDPGIEVLKNGLVQLRENGTASAKVVGKLWRGKIVRGFATPDKRFQFKMPRLQQENLENDSEQNKEAYMYPSYVPIRAHSSLGENEYILTTFKWNVHTQSRTANQIWLTEIVGDNPCWIHPLTAVKFRIRHGETFCLKTLKTGSINSPTATASLHVTAHVTECIHPRALAISASFGHWKYGRTARGRGFNPNILIEANMDPIGGGQAWNDTVVRIESLQLEETLV
ncbi:molybdopterin-dependent oxidoreductase [Fodinisporobacter ferrooxydans]|uniref:Molybdopterin-dependent oxidoreductase n=1 Tax=Fodinisporobacter ferrooxydans TaxID=2901836 RepID=A0ABY4CEY6_9BACL|nr:molybdopterin-dependent oxidoreductase [Alicyclobacillaceae bacterium MYW30-H2]